MKGYTDVPVTLIDNDILEVKVYVESLSDFILSCSTPMTIAIQGDWGSGKTSMMNMIRQHIESKVVPIWFNTWQYSQFEMASYLSVSLLANFLEKIGAEQEAKTVLQKITQGAKFVFKTATMVATEQTLGKSVANKIDEELHPNDHQDIAKNLETLKDTIKDSVVKKLKSTGKERVVVFVDDLDRLAPEKAVELLEVLKIFMDVPNCVFILAVDYGVITQGLIKKFGEQVGHSKGKSFFDKIIQLPFTIPIAQYNILNYINSLLKSIGIKCSDTEVDMYWKVVDLSVGCNPRSLKRLFNSFILLNTVATKKEMFNEGNGVKTGDKQRILFAILCLQMAFQEIYEFMIRNRYSLTADFFEGIKEVEKLQTDDLFKELRKFSSFQDKDEAYCDRIAGFMDIFYECLQLDDDLDNLSDEELKNLKDILSFSSITANTPNTSTQETVSAETKSKQEIWLEFWKQFLEQIRGKSLLFQKSSGATCSWIAVRAGIKGTNIQYGIVVSTRHTSVELWIDLETRDKSKMFYDNLLSYKDKIESDAGKEWEWERSDTQRKSTICSKMKGVNVSNPNDWQKMNDFLITEINLMQKAFQPYLEQVARELPRITNSSETLESKDNSTAE